MVAVRARPARYQQNHPCALRERERQPMIEARMGGIERAAVQVEREIRRGFSSRKLAVPGGIERLTTERGADPPIIHSAVILNLFQDPFLHWRRSFGCQAAASAFLCCGRRIGRDGS